MSQQSQLQPEALGTTGIQKLVQEKLQSKGYYLDNILDELINIAENAETATPDGTLISDYKTRLSTWKYIMEAAGYYEKQKNSGINLNFNFTDEIMRKNE